ncbi:MAG: TonB-dependent receptor [Bacteroidales bacterium]|nr:TonB-dependent receptor [Bacteroidales bacterium]
MGMTGMQLARNIVVLLIAIMGFQPLVAQQNAILSGNVRDQDNKPIELANVAVVGSTTGAATDRNGNYTLIIPAGRELTVDFSYIGYKSRRFQVTLQPNEKRELNVVLTIEFRELKDVEIKDDQVRSYNYVRLNPKEARLIPTMSGGIETMLKTLPGVSSTNELSSQYSVRGGNFDENLVYVNGIEIYRPFLIRSGQQEGLSFVNSTLVSGIVFSAGGWEAKYGDKMSSVLDITYRKPEKFAGSAQVSLLGAEGHIEWVNKSRRLTFLTGARYKTNQYVFRGLETKGSYKPNFIDVQGVVTYDMTETLQLSVLGYYSRNSYLLVPESRQTNFGTIQEAYRLTIYFDGQEVDLYRMYLGAASVDYRPSSRLMMKFIVSGFDTRESETFDIRGQYWIGKLENAFGDEEFGNVTEVQGVGTFMDHARNYLDAGVISAEYKGNYLWGKNIAGWGIKYQHEEVSDKLAEWELIDSAGYSLPNPPVIIGGITDPKAPLVIDRSVKTDITLSTNRLMGYAQNTWDLLGDGRDLNVTAGVRFHYWDYNGQFLFSPRASVAYKPQWKRDVVFRFSTGYYYQPPFYKELRNLEGELNPDIRAQKSIHFVAGVDINFLAWKRPFKFTGEAYYKYLDDLIPYVVDNVRIRYLSENSARGYATGVDFKINGEFIEGTESWMSLSFLKTEQDIIGDFYYEYYNAAGEKIIRGYTADQVVADSARFEPGYIPRPSDQRVSFAIFFQDYLPIIPSMKAHLTLIFGTGLPFGPPDSPLYKHTRRYPPYRRVDIGFSKLLVGEKTKFKENNPLRYIDKAWLSFEVFNLFQISNTVSYIWVKDINNRQYAVPNYLTPRLLNLKLIVEL